MDEYYTLGVWRAKEGREDDLVKVWKEIGEAFKTLPTPPGIGTLIQSLDDPRLFYSFGPWPSLEAIQEMRENAGAREAIGRMQEVCEEARPGSFRVVARVDAGNVMEPPGI